MKFSYDKKEDILALWFGEGRGTTSEEVSDGVVLDRDKSGNIVGLEIMDAKSQTSSKFRSALARHALAIEYGAQIVGIAA